MVARRAMSVLVKPAEFCTEMKGVRNSEVAVLRDACQNTMDDISNIAAIDDAANLRIRTAPL